VNGTHLLAVVRLALLVVFGDVSSVALGIVVYVAVLLVLGLVLCVIISVALFVIVRLALVLVDGLIDHRVLRVALLLVVTVTLVGLGCRARERQAQGREHQQKSPLKI
jgi:hypothetical protein